MSSILEVAERQINESMRVKRVGGMFLIPTTLLWPDGDRVILSMETDDDGIVIHDRHQTLSMIAADCKSIKSVKEIAGEFNIDIVRGRLQAYAKPPHVAVMAMWLCTCISHIIAKAE